MSSAKVVGIHGTKTPSGASRPLPPVVVKLRDHSKERIRTLLIELFNNADDALFAMADKAESNQEQATYFEAMRELRLKKKSIVLGTLGAVIRSYNDFRNPTVGDGSVVDKPKDVDDLSLIDDEKLEFDVAVEGMVQRLSSTANDDLVAFKARIESLKGGEKLAERAVPVSPELLCNGFVDGCRDLDADIRAKLIVFKLYERYVLAAMPKVYSELNKILAANGVLPDFNITEYLKGDSTTAKSTTAESTASTSQEELGSVGGEPTEDGESGGVRLDALRNLLRNEGSSVVNQGSRLVNSSVAGMNLIPQREILNTLSLFQHSEVGSLNKYQAANQSIDFNALLGSRLGGADQGKACADVDGDVINLVTMLFEFILDDRQLQAEMKSVISRLQIPILKVALLDNNFFDKGGHPARKLLNEITSSAIGWNPPKEGRRDRFKEKLDLLVEKITREFNENVAMFDELLGDFQRFVEAEKKRGELVEKRTRDSEKGRAVTTEARRAAQDAINKVIRGRAIPDMGMEFLRDAWSNVLVFRYLREGRDSESWQEGIKLVRHLVWSLCPDPKEKNARGKLLKLIPGLVKRIREGFEQISFDEKQGKSFLSRLEDQHILSLQALQEQVDLQASAEQLSSQSEAVTDVTEAVEAQNEEMSDLVRSTIELNDDSQQTTLAEEPRHEETSNLEAKNADLPKKQESIVLVDEQSNEELAEDDPFLAQVDRLVVGCWFEVPKEGGSAERCKLAAIIRSTGKHIFVNNAGVKVIEKKRQELAKDLKSGALQILNDGVLFDRALESIITNLQS